ncbi:beta-ketoacyl-[acyl-carrier-protein] synthase family protein [Desulfofustis glycolicus]|uniref:3-oxoacyl-[acyl-carrier-protein] synthase-1 n=1 Tax=Desulfofustis glycolicus DSM 9705 TaxID=1121409 RepID=A0A1M5UN44_9BACT|nr:beta-ketoacyl-[acyl-carrier-protein] synthase family protein [Desulfofustis glycolicus]MCB2217400.1 beta-ketoacyl-[acyl-carrier-protein] synthase family protein [Desulfobulbaceae bacterium]SHH64340.1 3-oxoacyl-[acyl-carrier-protein] synthase-1 [Desulfofustis glycolicus DSM 9705]
MTALPVYIAGIGIVSSLGSGLAATRQALAANRCGIGPLCLFELLQGAPLPVGQATPDTIAGDLPRTHQLAAAAALQAMAGSSEPPEAVIVGTTTGGILTTEALLRSNDDDTAHYRYHGLTTVAEEVARRVSCVGPALTVSTACSSGAAAITLAMRLLQRGTMKRILVGGADCLCRLTYFGFHSLQLVDRTGCRPLDRDRQGMSVAEGAALLLLTSSRPEHPHGLLAGAGLSCDAYHPASPHPEGDGALRAMQAALADAGLQPGDVDYLNLHGTGTPDNDLAEARAIHRLFTAPPPLSSIKGATGHSLAASGAIEAVVATLAVTEGLVPATTGCRQPDPVLDLQPILAPLQKPVATVLSNSFGFGGNNCCLVVQAPNLGPRIRTPTAAPQPEKRWLALHGWSCLTGAGDLAATQQNLLAGHTVAGPADLTAVSASLPARQIRRLKRLPRLALSLATGAVDHAAQAEPPSGIFLGTGWGALSETHDFLQRLAESAEQFPSPTDFVGSVHNAAAGQVAQLLRATGANITTSGGDYSFEQALLAADLLTGDIGQSALVLGVDEGHPVLSPRFDPSIGSAAALADGGGALVVGRDSTKAVWRVSVPFYRSGRAEDGTPALIAWCGGRQALESCCGVILAGIPLGSQRLGEEQLNNFLAAFKKPPPVIRYRPLLGEFASASAVAAVLAANLLQDDALPESLTGGPPVSLTGKTVLVLGLGTCLTAMEFSRA